MRNYPTSEKKFNDFLTQVKERAIQAFENQEYQFENLVEKVLTTRNMNRNPLFDVMFASTDFNETNRDVDVNSQKKQRIQSYPMQRKISLFDCYLEFLEVAGQLHFQLEYATQLFKEETILRLATYFKKVAAAVIQNPSIQLSQIELLSSEEKQQVLFDFNNTKREYPQDKTIHLLFEEQVERTPPGCCHR